MHYQTRIVEQDLTGGGSPLLLQWVTTDNIRPEQGMTGVIRKNCATVLKRRVGWSIYSLSPAQG
jgi:hypothetical protein